MDTVVTSPPASRSEIARLLSAILTSRFIINSAFRMGYAFAPELSRGLGVSLGTWSTLVGVRSGMGVFAPVFGTLSDRFGRRAVMRGAMLLFVVCAFISFISSSLIPFAVGFIGFGLAKVVFEPSASAFLGDRVPYERRGFVMGMSELGWASAALVGGPVIAFAINAWGWQSPFALLTIGGVIALLWVITVLPQSHAPHPNLSPRKGEGHLSAIAHERSAMLMLVIVFAFLFASDMIAISYAAFLERAFNVDVITLGSIVATFAIADMCGELLSMWGVDRVGKKRALLVGFACTIIFYFVMPLLGASLVLAVAALSLYYVCFEFTIVSVFPFISELVPHARGTLLSLNMTAASIGRMLGSFAGAFIFSLAGFGTLGVVGGIVVVLALVVFAFGVQERQH